MRGFEEKREERIHNEIIVDAYDSVEQAMGWYTYLSDTLQFPFSARCIVRRVISPLEKGEEVEVVRIQQRFREIRLISHPTSRQLESDDF